MRLDGREPPGRIAEHKRFADSPLVDELLVQLAQSRAALTEIHRKLAGVRYGPATDQGKLGGARKRGQTVVNPVPGDPSAQVAKVGGGKTAGDQPQDAFKRLGRKVVEGICAAHQVVKGGHVPRLHRDARDHLLGQDVQAAQRDAQMLDFTMQHRATECGRFEQVGGRLGDQPALADAVHDVPGSPDPLQTPGDVARRLDLANQVDRAHVDPQFERRGRDDRLQLTLLECFFGGPPFVEADAAMVGTESARISQVRALVDARRGYHGPRVGRGSRRVGRGSHDPARRVGHLGKLIEPRPSASRRSAGCWQR